MQTLPAHQNQHLQLENNTVSEKGYMYMVSPVNLHVQYCHSPKASC